MPIEIDDNEVTVPNSIPLPSDAPASAPEWDTGAPRQAPSEGIPSPLPPVVGRPAMELTPARLDVDRRAGVDDLTECLSPAAEDRGSNTSDPCQLTTGAPEQVASFRRASDIAAFLGCSKRNVHRQAAQEGWPAQRTGNRIDYIPPFDVPQVGRDAVEPSAPAEPVTFLALSLNSPARALALQRAEAVMFYQDLVQRHGVELALSKTVSHFAALAEPFHFAARSLRRWRDLYAKFGLNGLIDQKQGNVGRKPVARFLSEEQTTRLQAQTIEHGSASRAGRNLMRDPELHAGVRAHLHGAHSSKSYLPPSIRDAARTSPLTAALHTGPRAARLLTSSVHATAPKPGEVYCADDETPNVYVWEPWPNKLGYRIGRPQILQVADCGSLMPLCVRVIMRHSGAYTADDVAGTLGDAFDLGLPNLGLLLEGGVWRSNTVIGHKTNLSVEERLGGLASLGLQIFHARTPMAKWEIEGQFHLQQHIMDACPGYCGRNERETKPEKLKKQIAMAEGTNPKLHPSEFLLSLAQFTERVEDALREYAHECQDGKTLRGASPFEKWNEEKPRLRTLAEKDKWLYRSAMSVVSVKRNGELRISHGSGRNQRLFYYHNPALLMPRAGQEVAVFWNDHNPESDCVILAGRATNPKRRICIGTAKYVREISRFARTAEDKALLGEAMQRKSAELQYARSELRTIEPHLQRTSVPVVADATARNIGTNIAAAAQRHEVKQREEAVRQRADQSAAKFGARAAAAPAVEDAATVEILDAAPDRSSTIEHL